MPINRNYFQYISLFGSMLFAIAFMHYGAICGLILTPDAEQYLTAAEEVNTAGRWPGDHHSNFLYWPPLYPLVISLFEYPDTQLLHLNTIILLAIGILTYQLSITIINERRIRSAFVIISMLNVHMVMTGVFLWSELIFILMMMISLFCFFKMQDNKKYFALLILALCLLCLQRYAGLLIVFGLSASLLIQKKYGTLKQRLLHGSMLMVIPASLVFGWWHYVSWHHPEVGFIKRFSISVVENNLNLMLQALSKVFFPADGIIGAVLLIVLVGALGLRFRKQFSESTAIQQLLLVIFCYLSGFVLLGDLQVDEIDRYLSVVMPVMMLIAFFILDQSYALCSKRFQIAFLIGIYLWMMYPIYRTVNNVTRWSERSCNAMRHENRSLDE